MFRLINKSSCFLSAPLLRIATNGWKPYSRLIVKGDNSGWVLDSIALELTKVCRALDICVVKDPYYYGSRHQSAYLTSKYFLQNWKRWKRPKHRIAFPYFHGDPRISSEFYSLFKAVIQHKNEIRRIHVSHSDIEGLFIDEGVSPSQVFRIPISIDINHFDITTDRIREKAREKLGIPRSSLVVGSFQKDGIGFGSGDKPKLIKGPDIFLSAVQKLKEEVDGLFILLTGPARGYIRKGLTKLGIPYKHILVKNYPDISMCYKCLDLYLISSREEGGPRAVLESMASGIPLVTTRVGQAIDLVDHQQNGWMTAVEDVDELVFWAKYVLENKGSLVEVINSARQTAINNSYDAQVPLWRDFMDGFVLTSRD